MKKGGLFFWSKISTYLVEQGRNLGCSGKIENRSSCLRHQPNNVHTPRDQEKVRFFAISEVGHSAQPVHGFGPHGVGGQIQNTHLVKNWAENSTKTKCLPVYNITILRSGLGTDQISQKIWKKVNFVHPTDPLDASFNLHQLYDARWRPPRLNEFSRSSHIQALFLNIKDNRTRNGPEKHH